MATKVGTGYVSIEPEFDQFDAQVRARLSALDNEFKRVGRSAGDGFSQGFSAGRSSRELDTVRGKLSDVDREAKKTSKSLGGIGSGGGGGGIRNTSRDLDAFGGAAAGATATIGGFRVALAALVPVTIGFGGAAVAAGASLIPLAGLAAAAGNALAAAAQGMGVFKLATMGVADALKEQVDKQGKAASAAISTAGQQRAAARSIQSAQDGLRDAVRAASDAVLEQAKAADAITPAFTTARVRVNDLRQAVVDAGLSLRGAKLAAEDARQALADLVNGPDPRKLADAHRAITDAVRGEDSAVQALTDAHKALQDLLKPADALSVADATDAVADAVRNEERARLALNKQITETRFILQGGPGVTDDAQAQARLDLADAENAVGDATRQTEHAKEGLKKLEGPDQSAVEAARRKVSDAEEGVRRAAETTLSARKDLVDLEKPATSLELAKARLDVAQAENAVGDAERDRLRSSRDLAEAEKLGLSRAPEVVAARDALAKANRDVEDSERAVARAEQALGDAQLSAKEAMASAGLAAANLNEKFDKLPPAAQAFVRVLKDMKPRLDELRQTAAAGFFPGATEGLQAAAHNFDSVNKVVGQTATVLGEAARKSGELVGSPAFGKDLETIGGRNAKVLDTLGEALRHVVSALRYVALAAGPLTQHLADLINGWSKTAASSAKAGEESGRLAGFFQKTEDITRRLLSVLGHLGSGLLGVGKAGKDTGDDIWKSIDKAAKRFDEWANSAKGQKALKDFFREAKELAAALIPIIGGVAKGVGFLVFKALPLSEILKLLGPYADEATVAFVAFKVATFAAAAASNVAGFATKAWAAGQWLLNAALAANPIVLIVAGLAALAAGLIYAYTHSETFRKIVDGALHAVGDAFTWMWNAAKDVFNWLKENWPLVLAILTGPIGLAVLEIVKHWDDIKRIFTDGVKAVIDGITAAAQWFIDAGKNMVRWIVDGIKALASALADAAGWVKNRFVDGIQAVAEAFKSVGTWVLNRFVDGVKAVASVIADVAGWLKNRFVEGVKNSIDAFLSVGGWVLHRFVDGVMAAVDVVLSVGGWLKNRFLDGVNAAKDGFLSVGKSILGFIVDGMKSGGRLLLGFVNDIIDIVNSLLGAIGVDKIGHISAKSVGLAAEGHARGGVLGLARGGAFARTGGIVDKPMVMLGEEAPTHREWVIPENPAYRDRARDLLMQAWGTIGFAGGGVYSKSDLAALWKRANGGLGDANLMAAIALAESGGDPRAHNPSGASGLWQILGKPFPGDAFDPATNARMAGAKLSSQGLGAWVAYTNGAYRKFMGGGDSGGGLLGKITGAIGDLLSKGAGLILDKLPGAGGLPRWLRGIGESLLEKVGGWVKDKVSDFIGLGDGDGAPKGGVTDAIQGAMALARSMGLQITSTTGGQHAANSWHYKGRAADVAGTPAQMAAFYKAALGRYDGKLLELFYDPVGAIKNGQSIPAIGGHSDHVHIALAKGGLLGPDAPPFGGSFALGGIVPGPTGAPRLIEAHGGETVMPEGELRVLIGELRALNASPTLDVIRALVGIVNTQQGRSARHRSMTAGLGGFPATP
jgi:phage-related protein